MIEALTEEELNELNWFLQKYNEYRQESKGKNAETLDRYFCVKRDGFPKFKNALSFWKWVHSAYNKEYGNN